MSPQMIKHRLVSGVWVAIRRAVYRLPGAPPYWMQALWSVYLWAGGDVAVWGRAAARLWKFDGFNDDVLEIASPRAFRPQPGVHIHRLSLAKRDVTRARGLRVTTPLRTLLDLGSAASERRVEYALEDCLRRRLTALPRLRDALEGDLRGRRGVATLRRLVDVRMGAKDSGLEVDTERMLRRSNLPAPSTQYRVFDADGFVRRVDFAWPHARVAVEVQSYRWHSSRAQWERDLGVVERLNRAGWVILYVTWADVHVRPAETVARVRRCLTPRLA